MTVKFVLIFPVSHVRYFSKKIYRIKTNRHLFFMFYSLKKSIGMTSKKLKTQVESDTSRSQNSLTAKLRLDHFDVISMLYKGGKKKN